MRLMFLFLALTLWAPTLAAGQEVRAAIDRTQISPSESALLSVTIDGQQGGEVDVSAIRDFEVSPRGTSSSINIINGRHSSTTTYNYALIPLHEGRLHIPPLTVRTANGTFATEEIYLQVSREPQPETSERNIYVVADVSNPAPYIGEQVLYRFKLYTAVRIGNAGFKELPDFSGFSAKPLDQPQPFRAMISGREFIVHEVPYILIPLSPGDKTIARALLHCDVMIRSGSGRRNPLGSVFDDPFFSGARYETRLFQSEPITVSVKPLPKPPPNLAFTGLVGDFRLRAELESHQLKVGDSTTLSLIVEGVGNIMDAGEIALNIPDEFKVYKDVPEEAIALNAGGYSGKKVFRTALAPMTAGEFTIDAVKTAYFKIPEGEYRLLETQPLVLRVAPAEQRDRLEVFAGQAPSGGGLKETVVFTGRDILPLKEDIDAFTDHALLSLSLYLLLLLTPPGLFFMLWAGLRLTQKVETPAVVMAARAEKSLKIAAQPDISPSEFLFHGYRALVSAILAKANIKGENLTRQEAHLMLTSVGCTEEVAAQAADLLTEFDAARFSGMAANAINKEELLLKIQTLMKQLK